MASEVRQSLTAPLRSLPCKYFYDDRGSALFERITALPEYYQTRTEEKILEEIAEEVVEAVGPSELVELGSGVGRKVRLLLDAMARSGRLRRCQLLDINESYLSESVRSLAEAYPGLDVRGVLGDFTLDLTGFGPGGGRLMLFLAGTIGNLHPEEVPGFLGNASRALAPGDGFLVGLDLVKDKARLHAAYNDAAGVTAEFTLNVLEVLNRELDADFDLSAFEHVGMWDPNHTRVDLRLRALRDQHVVIRRTGMELDIAEDEEIRAEISTKFTFQQLDAEFAGAGLEAVRAWTSDGGEVALVLIRRA
jgi:L-histidine N-alpha-methyltransferase